jgi:hypothetical protein
MERIQGSDDKESFFFSSGIVGYGRNELGLIEIKKILACPRLHKINKRWTSEGTRDIKKKEAIVIGVQRSMIF